MEGMSVYKITVILAFMIQPAYAQDKREPPRIDTTGGPPEKSRFYKPDTEQYLPCKATGYPEPEYSWQLNGKPILLDGIEYTGLVDGNIKINSARKRHEGYYQCWAKNKHGVALSSVLLLQMAVLTFTSSNVPQEVYKGVGEYLKVTPRGSPSGIPLPVLKWNTISNVADPSPRPLALSKRVMQDKEGGLHFTHIQMEDASLLKVVAFNNYLDQSKGGSYTQVQVTVGAPVDRQPSNVYPPLGTEEIVVEGDDLELQCIFSGYPDVTVSWTPPHNEISETHEINGTLMIRNVNQNHEGRYECQGQNVNGKGVNNIKVVVQSRPEFAEGGKPEYTIITEGDSVEFRCLTTPDTEPPATTQWLFNGEPVNVANPGPRITFSEGNTLMKIVDVRMEDIRVTQCNASNVHDYVFADAALNVISRTTITTPPVSQTLHGNLSHVVFDCIVSADPLIEVMITWLRDDRPVQDYNDPNMIVGNNRRQLKIELEKVGEEERLQYTGKYACNATNGYSHQIAYASLEAQEGGSTGELAQAAFPLWIIILLAVIGGILLILILIFSCCIYIQRNKGDEYLVDNAERKQGNDPQKELDNMGFHDYQRPEDEPGMNQSLAGSINFDDVDGDSLAEYTDDFGKFTEDGSFIGAYDDRKKIKVSMA